MCDVESRLMKGGSTGADMTKVLIYIVARPLIIIDFLFRFDGI